MDKQAQDISARTLASIEDLRRACEGKPRKGVAQPHNQADGTRNIFSEIFGKEGGDVFEGLFGGEGKQ